MIEIFFVLTNDIIIKIIIQLHAGVSETENRGISARL